MLNFKPGKYSLWHRKAAADILDNIIDARVIQLNMKIELDKRNLERIEQQHKKFKRVNYANF